MARRLLIEQEPETEPGTAPSTAPGAGAGAAPEVPAPATPAATEPAPAEPGTERVLRPVEPGQEPEQVPQEPARLLNPKPEREEPPQYREVKTSLAAAPRLEPHDHDAKVDENGDGVTSWNEGHMHIVAGFDPKPMRNHNHKLLDPETREIIPLRATAYKPGSQKRGTPREKPPIAPPEPPPPEGPGLPGPPGGATPGAPPEAGAPMAESYVHIRRRVTESAVQSIAGGRYDILASILQPGDSILDVGCGGGKLYEWLTSRLRRSVSYYGLDSQTRSETLKEFVTRYPEVSSRLYLVEGIDVLSGANILENHFVVSTAFGLPSVLPDTSAKYDRLGKVVDFMRGVSDIMVVECIDRVVFERSVGDNRTAWSIPAVRELFGELQTRTVRRPNGSFLVVGYRDEIL